MEIIIGRHGNQKTRITDPTVSRQHCKVIDNGDGTYTIENLSNSGTYIDGVKIIRSLASADSIIRLGQHYSAPLRDIIGPLPAASSPKVQPGTFSIGHLKELEDAFTEENNRIAKQNRTVGLARSASPLFTIGSGVLSQIWPYAWVLFGIGLGTMLYAFLKMTKAETLEQTEKRKTEFRDKWVCPNPECNKYLPNYNYKVLVRNYTSCPYCKCNYVE